MEAKLALTEVAFQSDDKLAAKNPPEHQWGSNRQAYKAFGNKRTLFEKALARYLAGPVAFVHHALNEPTAFAVADGILRRTPSFLMGGGRGAVYDNPGGVGRWYRR